MKPLRISCPQWLLYAETGTQSAFASLVISTGSIYNFEGDAEGADKIARNCSVAGLSLSFGIVSGSHTRPAGPSIARPLQFLWAGR